MNRTFLKVLVACPLLICAAKTSFTQTLQADTGIKQGMLDNAVASFYNSNNNGGDQSRLYTGPEYAVYSSAIKGNAYLNDVADFTPGSVEYDGYAFKNVLMLYDIFKDCIVVQAPGKTTRLSLVSNRVQSFDILNHHFVYLNTDTLVNKAMPNGFYEQVYNGKAEVLVKYVKNIAGGQKAFISQKVLYVKNKNGYTKVDKQAALLDAFKDKKKELKQYIKSNQLKFNDDSCEQAVVSIAAFYDKLNSGSIVKSTQSFTFAGK